MNLNLRKLDGCPLLPLVETQRRSLGHNTLFQTARFTANSGFHSRENLESLVKLNVDAYFADNQYRQRDPDFDQAGRYKIQHRKERAALAKKRGKPTDSGSLCATGMAVKGQ